MATTTARVGGRQMDGAQAQHRRRRSKANDWRLIDRWAHVAHVGGDGQLRLLESADGEKWQSAALIGETGWR